MSADKQVKRTEFIDLEAEEESLEVPPMGTKDEDEESEHSSDREFINDGELDYEEEEAPTRTTLDDWVDALEEEWDEQYYQRAIGAIRKIECDMRDLKDRLFDARMAQELAEFNKREVGKKNKK